MGRGHDLAVLRYELSGFFRGELPYRFLPLLPAAAFLAAWTWTVASPFAPAVWLACVALEPRLNNMFYGSRRELEAFSLLPSRWDRIVLIKNLSTAGIAAGAFFLFSVITLYFSPEAFTTARAGETLLYVATIVFPLLILGNEASARHPRKNAGAFSGGISEPAWMSITLLIVSVPWFIITGLLERPLLSLPYAALTAGSWLFGSVPRTAARIVNNRIDQWQPTEASSNS
jgi:hypothetical protein